MKFNKAPLINLISKITSLRFCLSYDLLNAILSPSKFVYFKENLLCCHRRLTCGHNIIYDMALFTE